ncbi:hypothetical protein PBI_SMARTIES_37 [Microbacterium phage Smarties]|uniref:Uncharacterized protein n=1 Tax=Microbacterium phage Ariadne TaxID=2656546 RepID=A0A649VAQ0_9CAUD|nr:hypothetical protein QDA10_gp037 [Microbacterium phage Ariadne]QGJ89441.1 hypothetical protein PBI_ARIADNE_37 [Microbacterium phage Ariadne]QGJ91428.1 hypothetical protein PBI_SMARTIES_37 [Microbacterium phage Smarties]
MSDPTNTSGATVNTDAQTTSGPAGEVTYPDGSTSDVLEDRSAEFPGDYPEIEGEPIIETRDGVKHRLGTGSGMAGYRGLAAKRAEWAARQEEPTAPVAPDTDEEREAALALAAEKGIDPDSLVDDNGEWLTVAAIHERIAAEQGQEGGQEAPEGTGTDDDTSEDENGDETGDQGSGDEETPAGDDESESEEEDDESEPDGDEPAQPTDEGYDPSAHTVTEVTAYLDENPDQATYVLDRERTGKARVTLIGA